jgi:hypothetical protein
MDSEPLMVDVKSKRKFKTKKKKKVVEVKLKQLIEMEETMNYNDDCPQGEQNSLREIVGEAIEAPSHKSRRNDKGVARTNKGILVIDSLCS